MPDTNTPFFSVLIVNYNGGAYLQAALDSLRRQTFTDFEVIVVDNASSDGSVESIRSEGLPAFTLIQSEENLGFAAGNNLAAQGARGTWLALLNPDAVAEPDWLDQVKAGIHLYPEIVQFACTQLSLRDPAIIDGAGDSYFAFGIPWRGGYGLAATHLPQGNAFCFSPCGASAVLKRDIFLAFQGFDERFFCYCEDVELGFRMQLAGHDCVFLRHAIVRHAGSAFSDQISDFSLYHGTRNLVWTYWKNMPTGLLLITLPGHLAVLTYLAVRSFGNPARRGYKKGLNDGLSELLKMRRGPSKWETPKRRVGLISLAKKFAWNPQHLRRRLPSVRRLPRDQ